MNYARLIFVLIFTALAFSGTVGGGLSPKAGPLFTFARVHAENVPATGNGNVPATGNPPSPSTPGQNVPLVNPLGAGTSLPILLTDILQFFVKIGAVVVVFMLVYIGFLFVTAQGEPGKITKAREALMWTIVGALILLGAEAIAQGISATVQALSVGG